MIGKKVRMSEDFKKYLQEHDGLDHLEEFGHCVGIVEGLVDYGTSKGPEVDVRWQPSGFKYAYDTKDLVVVK